VQYKIKFLNETQDEIYFDHNGLDLSPATIDIDSWSYGYDGYTVKLPENEIFKVLRETEDALLKYSIFNASYTQIVFEDPNALSIDDLIWIDDELIKLNSKAGSVWFVERGYNGTRKQAHYINYDDEIGKQCFVNGRHSPLGMECRIYDEHGTDVFYGYVKEIHSNGAGVDLELDNIINKFDGDVMFHTMVNHNYFNVESILKHIGGLDGVIDFEMFPSLVRGMQVIGEPQYGETKTYYYINIGEILKQALLIDTAFLYYEDGIFKLRPVQHPSLFNTEVAVNLPNKIRFTGGYVSKLTNTGKGVKVTYYAGDEGTKELYVNPASTISSYSKGYIDIAIDKLKPLSYMTSNTGRDLALRTGKRLAAIFGLSLGQFEVDVTPLHGLEAGQYYNVPEEHELYNYVPSGIDAILLCLGITDQRATFIILESVLHNPVAPAFLAEAISSSSTLTQHRDMDEYVRTAEEDVELAYNSSWGTTPYFEVGDPIEVYSVATQTLLYSGTISSFPSGRSLQVSFTCTSTERVIVTYPRYASANTKQRKFLFNNNGVI